jgi:dipeptidyl aminopeptidase/acylaminoacyl peptidase
LKRIHIVLIGCLALAASVMYHSAAADSPPAAADAKAAQPTTLLELRKDFKTTLIPAEREKETVAKPPAGWRVVKYNSPVGKLPAYITPVPPGNKKRLPVIIWLTGGFSNSIGSNSWEKAPASNDQSAAAFREAGIVTMYPSLRGGNDNPGAREGFLGEVDDVLAAADFLAKQLYVDPNRIYLGGHSTGGVLALLTAECSDRFRAVFAFGPVAFAGVYGQESSPFNVKDRNETTPRDPIRWLADIQVPTFAFEGTDGNFDSLQLLEKHRKNPQVKFFEIKGADHFNGLASTSGLIAKKILADNGDPCNLAFTPQEIAAALPK